jgi:hypothetical protein
MADGMVNLLTPQGGTMACQGEETFFPWQQPTAHGVVWLTQVRAYMVPHLTKAGYTVAPDELQTCEPPRPAVRSLTNIMV